MEGHPGRSRPTKRGRRRMRKLQELASGYATPTSESSRLPSTNNVEAPQGEPPRAPQRATNAPEPAAIGRAHSRAPSLAARS